MKVIETREYELAAATLLTLKERSGLREFLAEHPTSGDLIQGLSGLRKLRWTEALRNAGKRGGTRVIYFYALSDHALVLLHAYSKKQKEDLTSADRKILKSAVEALQSAFAAARKDFQARGTTGQKH